MSLPKLNTPTYELVLPSTGKKVRYRPFLVKEHKVLLTMSEADDYEISRIVNELVNACTFGKLSIEDLAHFDIEYIFLNLRARSISEKVDVVVNCSCGEKIETSFSIDNLKVEKTPGHTNKIMLTDEYGIELRYPLFESIVEIFAKNNDEDIFNLIVNSIKGVYSKDEYWEAKEQTKEELENFINSLTKEQFDKIETFFTTAPKIVQVIETDCPSCKKHNVSRLEGLSNFFV